jgi:hypothetical protein
MNQFLNFQWLEAGIQRCRLLKLMFLSGKLQRQVELKWNGETALRNLDLCINGDCLHRSIN